MVESGLPIKGPAITKAGEFRQPLAVADAQGMRILVHPTVRGAKAEIPPGITRPTEHHGAQPVDFVRSPVPDRGKGPTLAEAAFARLLWSIIMGMHHHRFGTVNNIVTLRAAPAGVFVVFRILHFFEKTTLRPDVLAQAAADHAEKMLPLHRFTFRAKTTFVVACVNCLAIRARDLPA